MADDDDDQEDREPPDDGRAPGAKEEPGGPGGEPLGPVQPAPRVAPVLVPRWIQLVMLPIGLLLLWAILNAAGSVLLVFIFAAMTALILNPAVTLLRRTKAPRGLCVLVVYVVALAAVGGVGVLVASPISDQVTKFQNQVPHLRDEANKRLNDLQTYLDKQGIKVKIAKQGQTALQTLAAKVTGGTSKVVSFGTDLLKQVVTAGAGLILMIVLSVYMLLYGERIGGLVRRVMPDGDGTPEDDYPMRVQKAVSGYVRGQLLFSVLMGSGAGLGLYIFGLVGLFPDGKTYALAFGIVFGLAELIPFVGPFIGAIPPLLVALFTDPISALWVALLFFGLQQVEGHIVAPQVFSHSLQINPLLVIFTLLFGYELSGILGALIALPIAAIIRETIVYLAAHLELEPWPRADPLAEPVRAGPDG